MACCWQPATGANWSSGAINTRSSEFPSIAACSRLDSRHYPFGPLTAHVLGDLRTGENFHATNASLIEHDSNVKLQGFTDYRELAPLIRYRHHPGNSGIEQLMARDRSVTSSIDIRLQMRAAKALEDRLAKANKDERRGGGDGSAEW